MRVKSNETNFMVVEHKGMKQKLRQ